MSDNFHYRHKVIDFSIGWSGPEAGETPVPPDFAVRASTLTSEATQGPLQRQTDGRKIRFDENRRT